MYKVLLRFFTLFAFGALAYGMIEIAARGFTHISMGLLGGMAMVLIGFLNDMRRKGLSPVAELVILTLFITLSELVAGLILNVNLHLQIWDYSDMPFNFMGQICLPFVFVWLALSFVGIVVEETMRTRIFHRGGGADFVQIEQFKRHNH